MTDQTSGLIGIDWGTSRCRGYFLDNTGIVRDRVTLPLGIKHLGDRPHADVLMELLRSRGWPLEQPILLCGMVGSRTGWREAPYVSCPAGLSDLAASTVVAPATLKAFIVPGICARDSNGDYRDIMRGEETQVVGVVSEGDPRLIVAPGTHSKWIRVDRCRVQDFRTYLTGELFEMIKTHSIVGEFISEGSHDERAFCTGVRRSMNDRSLLAALFSVRTEALNDRYDGKQLASYLSGLVIGAEVADGVQRFAPASVTVVGERALSAWYGLALSMAGISAIEIVDGAAAAVRGLWRIAQEGGML